jgi:hypothetical protein
MRQASLAPWTNAQGKGGGNDRRDIVLVQGPAGSGKSLFAWSLYSRFGACDVARARQSATGGQMRTPNSALV